jgi:hypothetical protein
MRNRATWLVGVGLLCWGVASAISILSELKLPVDAWHWSVEQFPFSVRVVLLAVGDRASEFVSHYREGVRFLVAALHLPQLAQFECDLFGVAMFLAGLGYWVWRRGQYAKYRPTGHGRPQSHLVVTVHGIQTYGQWQERLEQLVCAAPSGQHIEFVNYKLGFFSLFAFMVPLSRWLVVSRFRNELIRLCRHPRSRIDLVGHSFGTHVIGWALEGLPTKSSIAIHTVILAGSVLRADFPWRDLIGQRVGRLANDCGVKDRVLWLSQAFVLFTGMAGFTGFSGATSVVCRNRYSQIDHGGYFCDRVSGKPDDTYMRTNWLPLLTGNDPIPFFDDRVPHWFDALVMLLANNISVVKLAAYAAIFAVPFLVYYNLYQRAIVNLRAGTNAMGVLTRVIDERILPAARVNEVNVLLDAAGKAIDQFPQEHIKNPGVALQLARLKLISADLERLRKLGNVTVIKNEAESAAAALRQIIKADPTDLDARYELAHSDILIGQVLADVDAAHAAPFYNEAITILEALNRDNPDDSEQPEWMRELSSAEEYLGDLLIDRLGKTAEAKSAYDKMRDALETLRRRNPQTYGLARQIAWAVNKQADVALRKGDTDVALASFQEARERLVQIRHLWDDANWVYTLVIIDNNIGLLQSALDNYGDALSTLKEAETYVNDLVEQHDPENLWWRGTLGWTLDNKGWILFLVAGDDQQRLQIAHDTLVSASKIRNALLDQSQEGAASTNAENPLWRSDAKYTLANIRVVTGRQKELSGDHCGAAEEFAEAANLNNATDPRDKEQRAVRTTQFLGMSAEAYNHAGDNLAAARQAKAALAAAAPYLATTKPQLLKDQASALQIKAHAYDSLPSGKPCAAGPSQ